MKKLMTLLAIIATLLAPAQSMWAAASLAGPFNQQFFNASNTPCNSCQIFFYDTGTSTAKNTWTDATQATANENPITLNTRGESPNNIFMSGTYRVVLKKPVSQGGAQIWLRDGITGLSDAALTAVLSRWQASGKTPTYVSGTSFSTSGDNRSIFPVGRRLEIADATTLYGRITASSYAGSLTTVTVALDSGALSTSISSVSYSLETPTNTSLTYDMIGSGTSSANLNTSGTNTHSGTDTFSGTTTVSGTTTISGATTISGTAVFSTGSTSFTVAAGTAPFSVLTTTTKVSNLNVDYVDGYSASATPTANTAIVSDTSGSIALGWIPATLTGKDADSVDGQSRVLTINADHTHASTGAQGGTIAHSDVTGVGTNTHSAIDTHIAAANPHSGSQPLDATLTSFALLGTAADKLAYTTALDTWAETPLTSFARSIIDDANEATFKATVNLEIGTDVQAYDATLQSLSALGTVADKIAYTTALDTWAETPLTSFGRTLIDDANNTAARSTLGVAIGTDVQAYNAGLADIAGLAKTDSNVIVGNGTNWVAESGATARTSLGLGSIATQDANNVSISGGSLTGSTNLNVTSSGTTTIYTVATGTITSPSAVTVTAGGSNQNITLTPSGSGYNLLNNSAKIEKLGLATVGPTLTLENTSGQADDKARIIFSDSATARSALEWNIIPGGKASWNFLNILGGDSSLMFLDSLGRLGLGGVTSPTAYINLPAGTATASTAPLKFTTGTSLTAAEAGAMEFTTDDLFFTITTGAARKGVVFNDGTNLTAGRVPISTTNGRLTDDADFRYAFDILTAPTVSATTFSIAGAAQGTANGLATLDGSGTVPLSQLTTTLTGKSSDQVDGYEAATLLARANHTGTQTMSTISDLLTLAAGTYAPTSSNTTNLDTNPTMTTAHYFRVGNMVTVSGQFTADATADTATTIFLATLPIASTFTSVTEAAGAANAINSTSSAGMRSRAGGANKVEIYWMSTTTSATTFSYSFTYQVL